MNYTKPSVSLYTPSDFLDVTLLDLKTRAVKCCARQCTCDLNDHSLIALT